MASLNQRILISASLVLILFLAGTAITLEQAFHDSSKKALQDRMLGKLYLLMGEAEVNEAGLFQMPAEVPGLIEFEQLNSGIYAYVSDQSDRIIWESKSSLSIELPISKHLAEGDEVFEPVLLAHVPHFLYSYGVAWETESGGHYPFTFHVIFDSASFEEQIDRYRSDLWGLFAVMAIMLLITQMMVLRWGLKPMRQVSAELNAIESGLQDKIQGDYPIELKRLTDNINSFVYRERKHQQRYRNALADLAHSLKTPITIAKGAISTEHDSQILIDTLGEQLDRMNNIVHYQLQRASTVGTSSRMSYLQLRPIVEKLVCTIERAHLDKHPNVHYVISPDIRLRMDEGDLMELLGNLIDNAYKWCRHTIKIKATQEINHTVISIENDGPGIHPEEVDKVLERGVRADQSMPGHGIGLAIVRDIVQAYDGTLSIQSNRDMGVCFIIRLK